MLIQVIIALCSFVAGLCTALYAVRLESQKSKAEADLLISDVVYTLENILHHYRQNYRFHDVQYKLADLQQNTWHNKFLLEKFFLMAGLYEINSAGRVHVRNNVTASAIERFLTEVKRGEFNKLLQIVSNTPSDMFYSHTYHHEDKKSTGLIPSSNLDAQLPENKLL